MPALKTHRPFLLILALHLALAAAFSSLTPLGEAPDEPAHLSYAQFVAKNGRLPASLPERREAGYRSTWPPLYHLLVALPLKIVGNAPPARLKSVGDTPRRLIPTNGQTIASFIHTADEAWPWRGLTLAWHLGRFISVVLTAAAVTLTYLFAWQLTGNRRLAVGAAALHAFLPQVLFIGSVLQDDNLLIALSGLIVLILARYAQKITPLKWRHFVLLGALLGLATVTKYNALPLGLVVFAGAIWLTRRHARTWLQLVANLLAVLAGALLTGGWWFVFIWRNFNQVDSLGWVSGSLAALSAGTADASLRQLAAGSGSINLPPPAGWLEWAATFFQSFWGLFGGGSTIEFPAWVYWLLFLFCVIAAGSLIYTLRATQHTTHPSLYSLLLLTPLLFLPLPLLRFLLSGSIVETAQGRHLFPALPVISLLLVWGVSEFTKVAGSRWQVAGEKFRASPLTSPLIPLLILPLLSLYGLSLIRAAYPPPIPLRTTADAAAVENPLNARLADSLTLLGYNVGQPANGILPITLVWQAEAVPPVDYLIKLTLVDASAQPLGGWIGQPVGGRYPTRAWDEGDIVRDAIPVPLLPNLPESVARLNLSLLDPAGQPAAGPVTLASRLTLPPSPNLPILPPRLRADGLPAEAPFSYRSTVSLALPDAAPPQLIAPTGQIFEPVQTISGPGGLIANFIVAANWPGGQYQFATRNLQFTIPIANRLRRFDPPPLPHPLHANFGNQITLLGYELPQNRVEPGQSFPVTLHWQANQTMGHSLVVFNHLLDARNVQRGGDDRTPQNYYTTLLWVPGEIVSDSYPVTVDANAPAGIYWLDVGLYPAEQPSFSLPLVENGQPIERNSVKLGPIKVGGPPPGVTTGTPNPQVNLNQSFGPNGEITLLGYTLADTQNRPILNSKLTLFWQVNARLQADYTVFVHFLDAQGKLAAQADSPPAAGAYPTSLWDSGETIVDPHELPALPEGSYSLWAGLYQPESGQRLPAAGQPNGAVRLVEIEVAPK